MGQAICLPQCTVAYPDAALPPLLPAPMRRCLPRCGHAPYPNAALLAPVAYPNAALLAPVAYPNAPLPTPMRARALPQCTVACPDAALPTPDAGYGHPGLLCSRPPQVLRVPVADGASCPGGCETR